MPNRKAFFIGLFMLVMLIPVNASVDTDGDGYPDWMEQLCGTNPVQVDRPTKDQVLNAVIQKVMEYFTTPPDQRQTILDQVVQLVIAYFTLPSEELLSSDIVSYSGKVITNEDLTVTIPAGTFSSNTEVSIYRLYTSHPFGEHAISSGYRIEFSQLPSKPVEIMVRYYKTPSGETVVAVGETTFIKSIGGETETSLFLPATLSNGYAIAEFPPVTVSSSMIIDRVSARSSGYSFDVWVLSGYAKYETQHFKIYFPASLAYSSAIASLGNALENAYDTYKSMGFDYSGRTKWPMTVIVKKLKSDVYGFYSSSIFGINYGTIEINEDKIGDTDQLRITAGHEFFHFVQSLYDPRSSISQAKGWFYTHYWLDEATAVWAEEKFSHYQNYISPIRSGVEAAPLSGMHAGSINDAKNHGYGMSALVKYLVGKYGESVLVDIYKQIKTGDHPVEAIWDSVGDPSDWYADFLKEYCLGSIYDDFNPLSDLSGKFEIASDKDTYTSFTESYPDLSGKLFLIRLNYPNMSSSAQITIKDDNVWGHMAVFKVKSHSIVYIDSDYHQITISNLRELQDNGWNLLVLMTNTRAVYPYTDHTEIKLEMNVSNLAPKEIWRGTWSGKFCFKFDSDETCWDESGTWVANVSGGYASIKLYETDGTLAGYGSGSWGVDIGSSITLSVSHYLMENPVTITGNRVSEDYVQGTWSVRDPDGSYATGTWSGTKL